MEQITASALLDMIQPIPDDNKLQLSKISVDPDYAAMWNVDLKDFLCLTKNGVMINSHLFRKGGFGGDIQEPYFMMLQYVEDVYPDSITKDPKRKRHLAGCWCIIDKNGIVKKTFQQFQTPYLVKGSPLYSLNNEYYNVETGFHYGCSYKSFQSEKFLFINNEFDKNKSKRGVLKISKIDGTFEMFT